MISATEYVLFPVSAVILVCPIAKTSFRRNQVTRPHQRHTMHPHYTEDSAAHQCCDSYLLFMRAKGCMTAAPIGMCSYEPNSTNRHGYLVVFIVGKGSLPRHPDGFGLPHWNCTTPHAGEALSLPATAHGMTAASRSDCDETQVSLSGA